MLRTAHLVRRFAYATMRDCCRALGECISGITQKQTEPHRLDAHPFT